MLQKVRMGLLILVGLINFVPVFAVLSIERLAYAYDIEVTSASVEILLRHRAVMFGIIGGFIIYSAFQPHLQRLAIIGGFISMASYVVLSGMVGGYSPSMQSVLNADYLALAGLLVIVVLNILDGMRVEPDA